MDFQSILPVTEERHIVRLVGSRRLCLVPCHMTKSGNLMPIGWTSLDAGDEMWIVTKHQIMGEDQLRRYLPKLNRTTS